MANGASTPAHHTVRGRKPPCRQYANLRHPVQVRGPAPRSTNGLHASSRTQHASAPPPSGGLPGPPSQPAPPHDSLGGPSHGLAVPPPPRPYPAGTRRCHPRPPPHWGLAAHHRRVAWDVRALQRGLLTHPQTLRCPRIHGHASPTPPRPHPHGPMRTRYPGPVGSTLDSASRTSPTRVGAYLPFGRLNPARPSLTIVAP